MRNVAEEDVVGDDFGAGRVQEASQPIEVFRLGDDDLRIGIDVVVNGVGGDGEEVLLPVEEGQHRVQVEELPRMVEGRVVPPLVFRDQDFGKTGLELEDRVYIGGDLVVVHREASVFCQQGHLKRGG